MVLLGNETVTLRTFAAGSADGAGRFAPGTFTDSEPSDVSVRPSDGNELQTLERGERTKQTYTIRTTTEVRTGDHRESRTADHVLVFGEWYEVRHVWPSQSGLISHYRALVVRLDSQPAFAHSAGYNAGHA